MSYTSEKNNHGFYEAEPLGDDVVAALDYGVRNLVVALRKAGFNTTDSGDGYSKDPERRELEYPHVMMVVPASSIIEEAKRLQSWIDLDVYLKNWIIEASYSPKDDVALLTLFNDMNL